MEKEQTIQWDETAFLNALQGAAAIISVDGEIVISNENWKDGNNFNWLGIKKSGSNYFSHCQIAVEQGNDYALRLLFGLREVLEGNRNSMEMTISVKNHSTKWCKVSVAGVKHEENIALVIFDDVTANMKAIHLLRESEERYSQHFQYSVSGIILGSTEGKIYDANPAACKMLGYTKEELMKGGRELLIDANDPAHKEMIKTREKESFFEGEKKYIHKNGHTIPVEIISVIFNDENGGLKVINTFRDKTKENKAEQHLEEERRFTKTVLNSIPGIFFVLNNKFQIIRWNEVFENELGYSEAELASKNILDIFTEDEKEKAEEMFKNAYDHGNNGFIARIKSKNNGLRSYHVYTNRFVSGEKEFLVSTGVDITEFLESEIEREKNYAKLTQLFENSPLAMVMISQDNRVKKVNNGFISLFGYQPDEVLGKNVNKLITSDKLLEEAELVSQQAFDGNAHQQETVRYTKKMEGVPVLINTVPIWNHGEVIAAFGIYVDLREQKQLEKKLQSSLDDKNILLQELHHRVKNNLAIIAGLLELQVIYENNSAVKKQLEAAHSRIFSIAKIHETLYQQNDVVKIEFNAYLDSIIGSMAYVDGIQRISIKKVENNTPIMLNLNQAVPLGLVVNELIHFNPADDESKNDPITIHLNCTGDQVSLVMEGFENKIDLSAEDESFTFQKLLIDTFIQQIEAQISYSSDKKNCVKINFKKTEDIRGSSSAITENHDLFK